MLLDIEQYKLLLKNKYDQSQNPDKENRYIHSLAVAKAARDLVIRFNLNCDLHKVEIAGLLHDYAKFENLDRFKEIVIKYNLDSSILDNNFKVLHSLLGPYILMDEINLYDEAILNAILFHTLGNLNMDTLAEVIFLADFIEENRIGEIHEEIREIAKTNFKKALCRLVKINLDKFDTELNRNLYKKYQEE